jgi:hypothetical protein
MEEEMRKEEKKTEEDQRLAAIIVPSLTTPTERHRKGEELSIKEKLLKAQRLGWEITRMLNLPEEVEDLAWVHAEGHRAERVMNHIQGRCSLAASLAFDLSEEEARLDCEIKLMEDTIKGG